MDFETAKIQMDRFLNQVPNMYLATTSKDGRPSIRQMSILYYNEKIYFQTSSSFDKTEELLGQKYVALGAGAYSLKGKAKMLGKPKDNPKIMENFAKKHRAAYESYSFLDDEVLFEVELFEAKVWNGKDKEYGGRETITTIDLIKHQTSYIFCK